MFGEKARTRCYVGQPGKVAALHHRFLWQPLGTTGINGIVSLFIFIKYDNVCGGVGFILVNCLEAYMGIK